MKYLAQGSHWKRACWPACAALLALLAAACSKPEDPRLMTSRCASAANALGEPMLLAAAKSYTDRHLADQQPNARDVYIWTEQIQKELSPDGSQTSPRTILDVADKWKRSEHCQKVLAEFKEETAKVIAAAAAPHNDNKCESLRSQVAVMNDALLGPPKQAVLPGVVGTLNNALGSFPPEKQQFLKAELSNAPEAFIGKVLQSCSSETKGALTAAINQTDSAASYVSNRTKALRDLAVDRTRECGDLPEVYCSSDLKKAVANDLRAKSGACDKLAAQTPECDWSAEVMLVNQVRLAQLAALKAARPQLERYIADPESVDYRFRTQVNTLANQCQSQAMFKGMRGNALYDYTNQTCLPAARQQLVGLREQLLRRVNARIEELEATPAAAGASAPASSTTPRPAI